MATSLRDMALSRDNHTCQECGATPDKLHVHHLAYGTDDLADLDEHGPLQGKGETMDERPPYMWTSDRTAQVNWIMELASDLHSNWQGSVSDYADAETYAETIVTAYLERMAEEREPMPDWWDEHDRGLLVRFIAQECES